ncbi:MAG: transcription-repair coupling factor, partial [Clostridiales bacterium]|nr:transcription-repair coupling factor [Clostridiales bacterium]
KIQSGNVDAVVAVCDAALSYTIPQKTLSGAVIKLEIGAECPLEKLRIDLVRAGYVFCDLVDGKGQFSVRGGIVDIFPPQLENPIRMEFFGDEVDQMGYFDVFSQRKTEQIRSATVTAAREILLSEESRADVAKVIKTLMKNADENAKETLSRELFAVENEADVPFSDKYISLIYPEHVCLLDYFDENATVFAIEAPAIDERLKATSWHMNESVTDLLERGVLSHKCCEYMKEDSALYSFFEKNGALILNNFEAKYQGKLDAIYSFKTRTPPAFSGNFEALVEDLRMYALSLTGTIILCENDAMAESLCKMLESIGMKAQTAAYESIESVVPEVFTVTGLDVPGFELTGQGFVCLSIGAGHEKRRSGYRKRQADKKSSKEKILSYADLSIGDYVVHSVHGIGKYMGLESVLSYDGVRSDHIKIQYAGTGILYVPCEKIDNVSKYIGAGSDSGEMKLSKLGGTEWERTKSRVKSEVKNMAKELTALYAERLRKPGFACSPDDDMQREFESMFEYSETDGQLEAAREIKSDMEKPVPMDRLLCGDVGFGKTEVALRAAFKAVANGKQVAILVPTTILAMQHYQTILSRMRAFPVKVSMLSRFRSPKEQAATVRALSRGDVDILVGTHRILSDDVVFRDLGLVIIDEEQRFGVAHKEKLKQFAKNVDVLTLTATPIPRTLNMAMSDIRDMSVLDEAPFDRLPVQTYVLEYDEMILCEAIRRELHRGGQIFYLHNNVESISSRAARLKELFPEAEIAIAHGQMEKEELSDIWQALVEGSIDILVCTTIIETGVDVPNANTLIIENADRLGLAQLHQIRGRVGRSSRRAYAYFTFPRGKALSEIQSKRLQAIRDFTEFGSGFKIAMRDLEIRGAGDILGARQSGHMESVGYDMYIKILNEVILEEKGEKLPEKTECVVNIGRDSYIPESYISSPSQRIDIYKKIAHITTPADVDDIADELLDRYGDLPTSVETLMSVSLIRAIGSSCGFTQVERKGADVVVYSGKIDAVAWSMVAEAFPGKIIIAASQRPCVLLKNRKNEPPLGFIVPIFEKYAKIKSEIASNTGC